MYLLFKDYKLEEDMDYNKYITATEHNIPQYNAFKFVISFFLTVAIRSKERAVLPDYLALIRMALKNNIGLCIWLIETFTS